MEFTHSAATSLACSLLIVWTHSRHVVPTSTFAAQQCRQKCKRSSGKKKGIFNEIWRVKKHRRGAKINAPIISGGNGYISTKHFHQLLCCTVNTLQLNEGCSDRAKFQITKCILCRYTKYKGRKFIKLQLALRKAPHLKPVQYIWNTCGHE